MSHSFFFVFFCFSILPFFSCFIHLRWVWTSDDEFRHMLALVQAHRIIPLVAATFPLSRVADAITALDAGQGMGKVCLTVGPTADPTSLVAKL